MSPGTVASDGRTKETLSSPAKIYFTDYARVEIWFEDGANPSEPGHEGKFFLRPIHSVCVPAIVFPLAEGAEITVELDRVEYTFRHESDGWE